MAGRRDGQVIRRGEGKWLIRWSLGEVAGKRSEKSRTVRGTRRDADRELRRILRDRDLGEYTEPHKRTVDELLDVWLQSTAKRVSGRTLADIRSILKTHVRSILGETPIQKLTPLDVQGMIDGMSKRAGRPLSPRTHQLAFRHLSQALRFAVRLRSLTSNPATGTLLPKRVDGDESAGQQGERRSLTRDELRAFLRKSSGTSWNALWQLMASTGCRPGEVLGLKWSDLSDDGVTFRRAVTRDGNGRPVLGPVKTRKTRMTPLPPDVIAALAAHRLTQREHILKTGSAYDRTTDLVFPNTLGGPKRESNLRERHFKPLLRRAGIQVQKGDGPYLLRHTVVTQLLLQSEAPQTVAERVGDSVATIVEHYAHAVPGLQKRATETIAAILYGDS